MFVSLDIETTGLDKRIDRIIEFGAVKFDLNGNFETLQILINPGTRIPEFITYLTGITDEELKDAITFEEAKEKISEFIGDSVIIGHFVQFDIDFLKSKGMEINNDYYDTSELARIFFPGLPSYSLEILSGILQLTHEEKHRALDDSIAAQGLFLKIIDQIKSLPKHLHEEIIKISAKSSWKFAETLKSIPVDETIQSVKNSNNKISRAEDTISEEDKEIIEILNAQTEEIEFIEVFNESQNLPQIIAEQSIQQKRNDLILLPRDLLYTIEEKHKIFENKNRISEERLKRFKQKDSFTQPETTALIKILIWLDENKENHSYEDLPLNPDERQIIQHIKSPKEEDYKNVAQKETARIADHRHDIEGQFENIIIFDTIKFIENTQAKLGVFLNIKKAAEPLDSLNAKNLKEKLEIIFGIIENFLPTQVGEYGENYIVTKADTETPNWKRITETTQFLIQESQNFKDIISEETLPYLQDWKTILHDLESTFINSNFDYYDIVIQKNRNNETSIRQIAKTKLIQKKFFELKSKTKNIAFIGKALNEGENGKFVRSILGINESIASVKSIKAPQEIIQKSQIFTVNDIRGNAYEVLNESIEFIKKFLEQEKGQSVIIFNSGKKLDQTHQILAPKLKKANINLFAQRSSGGSGKIIEMYKKSPETSSILITPNKWENFDHNTLTKEEDFKTIIIHQIPFDPPSDNFINALSNGFSDQWKDFSIPSAILQLKKIIGKFLYKTPGRIIILDSRILEKSYSTEFINALTEFTTPTQVSSQELLKII